MTDLYRLIYTSRNLLAGSQAENAAAVAGILALSKRNNARVAVTGALLFNAGCFAQVLEGPRGAVEATFERIQRDPRHSDVHVLAWEPADERGFPNWSMAFVGQSARGRALWGDYAARTGFDLRGIEADRLFATLLAIVERDEGGDQGDDEGDDEGAPVEAVLARPPVSSAPEAGTAVERLHAGPRMSRPEPLPLVESDGTPEAVGAAVLRDALDEERARTTALRRELDDARIAVAAARAEVEAMACLRDLWAERARAMAAILAREPEAARPGDAPESFGRPTLVRAQA